MKAPLDRHEHDRTGMVRAARTFSNVISPPLVFAVLGMALALAEEPSWRGFLWGALYGILLSLLPILLVLYLLKTGRIAELHMSNTSERHLPYLSALAGAAIMFAATTLGEGPALLRCLTIFNMIELAALALINSRWLISFHATAIAAAWLIVALVFGWAASLPVFLLVILIVIVRLYLRRHTVAQIVAGLALGIIPVWGLTTIGCFVS